jgi:lipopolysaccharide transport system ATP-binding protein
MGDTVIRVENLGKRYRIGKRVRYQTLRDSVTEWAGLPLRWWRNWKSPQHHGEDNTFWALRDLSFEVHRGDVLGIIGSNGAGKSTLLRILSRITEPTTGQAELHGRIGSLLEVGTGFHPELTGRENIFLNGAILGMKRREIVEKFDDIVAFAEVEQFIDTPVKHYSSGMYTRLAFAVAAHLEPEILIVDEVLAVGDAAFQQKCLGKMGEVARQGRTVLFVSHNMDAVARICGRAMLLEQGSLSLAGSPEETIASYYRTAVGAARGGDVPAHVLFAIPVPDKQRDPAEMRLTRIEMRDGRGQPKLSLSTGDSVSFRVGYRVNRPVRNGHLLLEIYDQGNRRLCYFFTEVGGRELGTAPGTYYLDCHVPRFPLAAGEFHLGGGAYVPDQRVISHQEHLARLTVQPADVFGCGRSPTAPHVILAVEHAWNEPGEGALR